MVRELMEKEVAALKCVLQAVREWIHPTTVMKRHAFDRPLDDLGQTIDDVERRVQMAEQHATAKVVP